MNIDIITYEPTLKSQLNDKRFLILRQRSCIIKTANIGRGKDVSRK